MGTPAKVVTPPSHWYNSVLHFFKHIGVYVSDNFVKLFGKDAAHTFAVGAESLLHTDLGKIVGVAVQEVESLATGTDKMAAALAKVLAEATKAGLDVKESLARMLIELAVARLKGLFGSAPPL